MPNKPEPLQILFGGEATKARLLDGTECPVFVRELPDRYLGLILECCEDRVRLIELCCYLPEPHRHVPAYPQVPPPSGFHPVPHGWADNLEDESIAHLADLAEKLNFSRAAKKGEAMIAAKKKIEPLYRATLQQVVPVAQSIVAELLNSASASTPNTPSSPAARAKKR